MANAKQLAGRVVLVTGASSGIGEGVALAFGAAGATVVPAGRRLDRVTGVADRVTKAGGTASPLALDVTDEAQTRAGIAEIEKRYGRLDVLVNNAGIMLSAPTSEASTADWRTMIDANLFGLMQVTHAAVPLLKKSGGHVFNISSVSARLANAGSPGYAASKAAVVAFTESLRKEMSSQGVRVTVVLPGIVETELFTHITNEATRQRFGNMIKAMTPLQPADIANAIVFANAQPPHVSINELVIRPTQQAE